MNLRDFFMAAVLIILVCVSVYFLLPAYTKYRQARLSVRELQERLDHQQMEVQKLRRELDALRTDYRAIERVAREKFGLCRDGERIYHFEAAPAGSLRPESGLRGAAGATAGGH